MKRNLAVSYIQMWGLNQVALDASDIKTRIHLCKVSVSEGININEIIKLN